MSQSFDDNNKIMEIGGDECAGFIKTNTDTYEWDYDKTQQCCENFGARFDVISNLNEVLHKHIYCVKVEDVGCVEVEDNLSSVVKLKFHIGDESGIDGKFIIYFFNTHNGYYAHHLSVKKNGIVIYNLWI